MPPQLGANRAGDCRRGRPRPGGSACLPTRARRRSSVVALWSPGHARTGHECLVVTSAHWSLGWSLVQWACVRAIPARRRWTSPGGRPGCSRVPEAVPPRPEAACRPRPKVRRSVPVGLVPAHVVRRPHQLPIAQNRVSLSEPTDSVSGWTGRIAIRRELTTPDGAENVEEGERAGWRPVARVRRWSSSTAIS